GGGDPVEDDVAGGGRDDEVVAGLGDGHAQVDRLALPGRVLGPGPGARGAGGLVLEGRLRAPGQGEKVVDQAGHAAAGPFDHGDGLAEVLGVGVRVGQGDVDVGADDGQGVAQLVGGVG